MPYATYRFNKIIAAETIRFIVTVAIVVYKGLKLVVYRMLTSNLKLYVNGNNLWVWTRMPDDRESNFAGTGWASQGAYPTVKRINFGLKFTL